MQLSRKRMIEWWALLNSHVRPSDMPRCDSEEDAFQFLTGFIPRYERLAFWNGDFKRGLNAVEFK